MMPPGPQSQARGSADAPIRICADGSGLVVLTPDDYDRFVETQAAVIHAVLAAKEQEEADRRMQERIGAFIAGLRYWCKNNPVELCLIFPRMDDILVLAVAADEDHGGRLHDAMSEFDLENFRENQLRVSWILLRRSERAGIASFADPDTARVVFHADPKTA